MMRNDTILNEEDYYRIESLLDDPSINFIIPADYDWRWSNRIVHDALLEDICLNIEGRHCDYGIQLPYLMFEVGKPKYSLCGNYREIIDLSLSSDHESNNKKIYAYFDCPIETSKLFLSTFDHDVAEQLMIAINKETPKYRFSRLDVLPVTFQIDVLSSVSIEDCQRSYSSRQTLRFLPGMRLHHSPIYGKYLRISSKDAFDVIDMHGLPATYLDNITY